MVSWSQLQDGNPLTEREAPRQRHDHLRCNTVSLREQFLTLCRILLPSTSEWSSWRRLLDPVNEGSTIFQLIRKLLTQQNSVTSQKTWIISNTAARTWKLTSLTCQTTSATDEVDSVSTTTVCPGCTVINGACFRAFRSFFFFRTLVIRAGPRFFFPADHKTEHEGYKQCNIPCTGRKHYPDLHSMSQTRHAQSYFLWPPVPDVCTATTKLEVLYFKMNGYSLQEHLKFSLHNFDNILPEMMQHS